MKSSNFIIPAAFIVYFLLHIKLYQELHSSFHRCKKGRIHRKNIWMHILLHILQRPFIRFFFLTGKKEHETMNGETCETIYSGWTMNLLQYGIWQSPEFEPSGTGCWAVRYRTLSAQTPVSIRWKITSSQNPDNGAGVYPWAQDTFYQYNEISPSPARPSETSSMVRRRYLT